MYPFPDGLDYVHEAWYVAGFSDDFGEKLTRRWYLDQPVVIYRTAAGEPVALDDRCAHRAFPLSEGTRCGDSIQCGYHGFTFGASGRCEIIPTQSYVPPGVRVRRYPLVEKWNLVWIWMGREDSANPDLIPSHYDLGVEDPHFVPFVGGSFLVKCRYQLLNENLLDLSHLNYIHPGSLGTEGVTMTPISVETDGNVVRVTRTIKRDDPTELYKLAFSVDGPIDRKQVSTFYLPGVHTTHITVNEPDSDANRGQAGYHGEHKGLHFITPARANETHYFWGMTRTYLRDDASTEMLRPAIRKIFNQDVVAAEAQEEMLATSPFREFSCKADEGSIRARRLLIDVMRRERSTTVDARVPVATS